MTDTTPAPSYGETLAARMLADPALAAQLAPPAPAPARVPAVVYTGPGGEFTVRRSASFVVHQTAVLRARGTGHYMNHEYVDVPADAEFFTG